MDKRHYKEYFHYERENWWFKVRYQIIDHFFDKFSKRNIRILNIGVATGHSMEILMKYGEVVSVEYDKDCCQFTQEALGIDIINGSITELPFAIGSFDAVCAFDVIEHVENDSQAVSEISRVCRPGGRVFITVPAFMTLWSKHDEINFHFRSYRAKGILSLFKDWETIHAMYFNTLLFPPIFVFQLIAKMFPNFRRSETGSDFSVIPQKSILNKFFYGVFHAEYRLLKFLKFPFGVSYLYVGQK